MIMKPLLNWIAAAASFAGLFFTLQPISGAFSERQVYFLTLVVVVFGFAAARDILEEIRRSAKAYRNSAAINEYMYSLLRDSGRCEICSRDASWISDRRIYALLEGKAKRGELTFLVHKRTPELISLKILGAEVIEYGALGFDPITRFTIANAGNHLSSYVAIGHRRPNEDHIIEQLDATHPTYSMAIDLIRAIRVANDNFKKIKKPSSRRA